jgi:hypothetical protein
VSDPVRVFLAGEGKSELGSRAGHPAYQSADQPGVLETLLRRVRAQGWDVGGAREWKSVKSLRVGIGANETKRVLALALDAAEAGCQVLAFSRDRDNDFDRVAQILSGIEQARADGAIAIIGAVAVPLIEGWILALRGVRGTENLSPGGASRRLTEAGVSGARAYADTAASSDLDGLPADAHSLRAWLAAADASLPR